MTGQYHQSTPSTNMNVDETINTTEAAKQHSPPPRTAYGAHYDNKDLPLEPWEYARISRRIDIRVVPIMFSCYFLQFLDKVIINYANVMGLQTDLHMKGNDFSWLATAFFIAFAVSEIPQGYLLQRFSVPRVLGINILGWGIIVCCTAAVQNFASLLALRILLGCFEAVISPALVLTTATWYTKRESGPRYGLWYSGLGVGQIVGGLISFAAQHGPQGHGFVGWRIMMVCVGAVNLLVAVWVLLCLPSSVESARFLREDEKKAIHAKITADQAGNGEKVFHRDGLWDAFTDLQIWLLFLLTLLIVEPSGIITTFSAVIIRNFGYTSREAALLNMPSGVVSIASTLCSTFAILKGFPRWLSIVLLLIPAVIGAGLFSFLDGMNQPGRLAGIYLINTIVAPLALIFTWVGANTAGYTKRVVANGMVAAAFGISNIIGPQTFQASDAPNYIPAKITVFAVAGAAVVVSIMLRLLYGRRNANKISIGEPARTAVGESDRINPYFRYQY